MYTRFIRWASDRLDKNGVIAFISNSSFINANIYDGFRKVIAEEFNDIYVINLKGDARNSGEQRRREGGNIFSDQIKVGVAVYFLVRRSGEKGCRIHYNEIDDHVRSEEKKAYLRDNNFNDLKFRPIKPSKDYSWINISENDWEDLIPIASKDNKNASQNVDVHSIFRNFSIGVVTARDEWVTDFSDKNLAIKMKFFVNTYDMHSPDEKDQGTIIKWSRNLRRNLERGAKEPFNKERIYHVLQRPYCKIYYYDSEIFINDRAIAKEMIFNDNLAICFNAPGNKKPFNLLATNLIADFHLNGDTQCFPFYHYLSENEKNENVTNWAINKFQKHYKEKTISKLDIFHYVYSVLHHPSYRAKYEQNLKREFPRIPFYEDFWKWTEWGKRLMELHLHYETVESYPLQREEKNNTAAPSCRLIARKETGVIEVDTVTTLRGVPDEAWEYRLGTYSALEWVVERYKEKKPKDPTIAEKFNTYKFADYKENVIDLIGRVCKVSMETIRIISEMPNEK
jgi:predicted helicase